MKPVGQSHVAYSEGPRSDLWGNGEGRQMRAGFRYETLIHPRGMPPRRLWRPVGVAVEAQTDFQLASEQTEDRRFGDRAAPLLI